MFPTKRTFFLGSIVISMTIWTLLYLNLLYFTLLHEVSFGN